MFTTALQEKNNSQCTHSKNSKSSTLRYTNFQNSAIWKKQHAWSQYYIIYT